MARIIHTNEWNEDTADDWERSNLYNAYDVLATHDIHSALNPQLDAVTRRTYEFSKALQGPVLEMRIRGVMVDLARRHEVINELAQVSDVLERQLNRIVLDGIGMPAFNWRSHQDLQSLFYRHLALAPIITHGRATTDRGAREKLEALPIAAQLVKHINILTELGDKISVLQTNIDRDGRIRTSYNIAGTNTGRFSSSLSEFGTGGNLQNVEESLRSIFIADPGYKFAKCDAKSGESFCVGAIEWNRFGDGTYLDVCESGFLHEEVTKLIWPELGWTGDRQIDSALARRPFHRGHTYRDMSKKLGHGSSYGGYPFTLSEQSRIPLEVVAEFQRKYFAAFPAHRRWQADVSQRLRRDGNLVSLMGRRRWFFGRRDDPETLRGAIAYDPQGSLVDIVNTAMINIWRQRTAIIMMHDHDALTFMYREEDEDSVIPQLLEALVVPVTLNNGRTLKIPYDVEVGWNKAHYDAGSNPDGLLPYRSHDPRKRQPIRKITDLLLGESTIRGS